MTMILVMLTLFIGGLTAWMIEGWNRDLPRWISLGSITLAALLLAPLFQAPAEMMPLAHGVSAPWLEYINVPWIPRFGISFLFAIDGHTLLLVTLTIFLVFVAVLSSWS
jgi:NADH-quinone oxidoreductase subunit M